MDERLLPMMTMGKNRCCRLLFHSINGQPTFLLLDNCNDSGNGEDCRVRCAQFNDVGDSVIVELEVFVKSITIFILKKTFFVVFTTKMYGFFLCVTLYKCTKLLLCIYLVNCFEKKKKPR